MHHLGRGRFDPRILTDLVRAGAASAARASSTSTATPPPTSAGWPRARLGAALVLHEHFADPRMPAYQGLADRVLAPLTDRAIAVSESTRDFLVRERHVPAERVRLIWNGAPLDEFAPRRAGAARARRGATLGLPEDALVVGTIGRLNEQKGHRYLLEAAPALLAARPRRAPPDRRRRRPWSAAAGAGGRAWASPTASLFAGHRDGRAAPCWARIDVFCISSTYEGTPLALFEAMAAGKAIVSTAVDGCREVLEDGVTGLLVPPARSAGAGRRARPRARTTRPCARPLADSARAASAPLRHPRVRGRRWRRSTTRSWPSEAA